MNSISRMTFLLMEKYAFGAFFSLFQKTEKAEKPSKIKASRLSRLAPPARIELTTNP